MREILGLILIALLVWLFWPRNTPECPQSPNYVFPNWGKSYPPEPFNNTKNLDSIDPELFWDRNDNGNQPS